MLRLEPTSALYLTCVRVLLHVLVYLYPEIGGWFAIGCFAVSMPLAIFVLGEGNEKRWKVHVVCTCTVPLGLQGFMLYGDDVPVLGLIIRAFPVLSWIVYALIVFELVASYATRYKW